MSLYGVTDTTQCRNCGAEFADHNYVENSLDVYDCPHTRAEACYGFFHGGDPRKFTPDYEECRPEEIQRWKEACKQADELEAKRSLPCPSGWERTESGGVRHVLRAPFGIGTYVVEFATQFEPQEQDYDPAQTEFVFDD